MGEKYYLTQPLKVAAICGSVRPGSYTRAALKIALQGAAEFGAEVQLIELRQYDLPFVGMMEERDYPGDVHRLRNEIAQTQGIILGTPEYHGSLSGILKNALDFLSARELEGKVCGLVGVAAGRQGAANALNSLRIIGRNLHAWVLPREVSIGEAYSVFDDHGNIRDRKLENRLRDIGRLTARFAAVLEMQKSLEIVCTPAKQLRDVDAAALLTGNWKSEHVLAHPETLKN